MTFPDAILAQHIAVVGKTGSGKTTTAKLLVEKVAKEGARVCILDPVKSDWWGLISSADGKRPGLPFHILGGPRGHVPLHDGAGKAIGDLVASGALPLSIIDMADFAPGGTQRFFIDFAEALFKRMRGIVYLVIEEAHEFAPKERAGIGNENYAIHWAKKLATAGRVKGIRLIVVTQRTQSLHNALLGSCETLITHRLTLPADQKPIVDWLKANLDKATMERVAGSLSSLKTGTGWICSGEAKITDLVHFPRISTYDNSATPTSNLAEIDVQTAHVDQDKLRAIIGVAVRDAEANDPKALKARIAELERQLAVKAGQAPDPAAIERARGEGHSAGYRQGRASAIGDIMARIESGIHQFRATLGELCEAIKVDDPEPGALPAGLMASPTPSRFHAAAPKPMTAAPVARPPSGAQRGGAARAILTVLVQHAPARFSWNQAATLAGLKARGGHFNTGRQILRERGWIIEADGLIAASEVGMREIGADVQPPKSPAEVLVMWLAKLPSPAPDMLRYIVHAKRPVTRDDLARGLGKQPRGGHWNTGIAMLRSNALVTETNGLLTPAGILHGAAQS